jgi:hypothetical protein
VPESGLEEGTQEGVRGREQAGEVKRSEGSKGQTLEQRLGKRRDTTVLRIESDMRVER